MRHKESDTLRIDIWVGGDYADAKRICREWTYEVGQCVTLERCDFTYTGGAEAGVRVGLVRYPRFPATRQELWEDALALADRLLDGLHQHSVLLVGDDCTEWYSRREDSQRGGVHVGE